MQAIQWQLLDSALPTGGFAHSLGLEAAASLGFLRDRDGGINFKSDGQMDLWEFIDGQLESVASLELPYVYEAYTDPSRWVELDRSLKVRIFTNPSAFKASRSQGQALIRCGLAGLVSDKSKLNEMHRVIQNGKAEGLFAPVFGIICKLLEIDVLTAQYMYLYICLRDAISAAKRLALVGPMAAVELHVSLAQQVETYSKSYANRPISQATQLYVLGDYIHSAHSKLDRKLFLS